MSNIKLKKQDGSIEVMDFLFAKKLASRDNLDLVCLDKANNVYTIRDEGKYLYDLKKKKKEQQKNNRQLSSKTVRLLPNIDTNDLNTKIKHIQDWLDEGRCVTVEMRFKGRMTSHQDIGINVLKQICEATGSPFKTCTLGNTLCLNIKPCNKKRGTPA